MFHASVVTRSSCLVALLVAVAVPALRAQEMDRLAFVGATVIDPVRDEPIRNATVLVVDGKIQSVTRGPANIPSETRVIDLNGRYLVPGLIDAHVHIASVETARRALHSGVTTARSMGVSHFADVGLRELSARGVIEAPEIVAAGYHVRPEPTEALFIDAPELGDLLSAGVRDEAAIHRMARVLIGRGVNFIKAVATERAGLPETDPRKPLYEEAELRALVDEAETAGVPVAAHAHGDEGGRAAVLAGVRSIEHGTYLSPETLRLMVERGTYLVPTIAVVVDVSTPGGDYDNAVLQVRGRHMLPRVRETAATAHRLGVRLAAATDTRYGPGSVVRLSHELIELVGVGLSPLEAIRSATTVAAELLGVDDHAGRVAAGFDADLLVLERNPLDDIGAYQDVLMVVNDGRVVVDRVEW